MSVQANPVIIGEVVVDEGEGLAIFEASRHLDSPSKSEPSNTGSFARRS